MYWFKIDFSPLCWPWPFNLNKTENSFFMHDLKHFLANKGYKFIKLRSNVHNSVAESGQVIHHKDLAWVFSKPWIRKVRTSPAHLLVEKRTILETWYTSYFFRNKTFLFVKIDSWKFQDLFDLEFRKTLPYEILHKILNQTDAENFSFVPKKIRSVPDCK